MKKKLISRDQLAAHLAIVYTAQELAKAMDCTTQYAYEVLKGGSIPSHKMLFKLGIEVAYEVTR